MICLPRFPALTLEVIGLKETVVEIMETMENQVDLIHVYYY